MTADHQYFAKVWHDDTVDRPSSLWRRAGNAWEYLSLLDWTWHPHRNVLLPHPDALVPISADHAATLLRHRQRFVRYWGGFTDPGRRPDDQPTLVYRRRSSPEHLLDEVFGRSGAWSPTTTIREFLHGGPHEPPDLVSIDHRTAERIIRETRGVTGETEL